jgi:hypothetical protein
MQPMLNYWEAALHAMGGALAHEKSYWSLVDFKWENDKWRYCNQSDMCYRAYFPRLLSQFNFVDFVVSLLITLSSLEVPKPAHIHGRR